MGEFRNRNLVVFEIVLLLGATDGKLENESALEGAVTLPTFCYIRNDFRAPSD